ncbi:MAG: PAS domain S-box protein [Holophagaceae bacterium]|uniref:histidine kinase n=1 Tax=Candidatus Geothrix skivensis TaxID=2954439 RepID=A0A9D7SF36_9BACT|nr:PAS domain S-box protein [Candidatus Geothrix skivensis]
MEDQPPPRDLQQALAASELRAEGLQARLEGTRGILDAISESIYILAEDGRFLDVNEGAVRMYGHPRAFFPGKTPEVLSAPGRNDLAAVGRATLEALQGKDQQFEFWGLRADGSTFPKDVRLYPGTYLGQKVIIAVAQDISERKRAEQIRDAAYRISEAALQARDLPSLYQSVHAILLTLVPAENCFVALHDERTDTIQWPYWVDQVDEQPAPRPFGRGLTEFVIRTGRPQLLDETRLAAMVEAGEAAFLGSESLAWMGVPLRNEKRVFGALVIQSYEGGYRYRPEDLEILSFVSTQIAMAIDRKTSEEQLRLVSAAVEDARDSLFWINESGRFEAVNRAACLGLGYTREELLGMSVPDIDESLTAESWKATWEQLRRGTTDVRETTQRRKDGTFRPVELSRVMLTFEGRDLLFVSVRDITVRKAAEAALLASEEKFSRAFHGSPDAINLTRLEDGTYLEVSEGFEKITGWSRAEAIGNTALAMNIWADPQDRSRIVELLRTQGEYMGQEIRFRRKDGSFLTGLMSGRIMEVDGVPCLLSVTRDISDRQAAESALRMAEQRLRTVLANTQAVIYQLDPEGRFLLSEGLGLANLGLSPGQVVGQNALQLYQADLDTVDQIRRALAGQASRQISEAGGRRFDNFLTPVFDEQGRLESVIGIATDVTERLHMEEALRQSQKLESLGLLAGGIAHDFNNLLTVVMGNLNLAQMNLPEDARAQAYLTNMEATVLRATELTKQMLAYSGRGHFLVKPQDLNEVVHEVTHLLEVSISKKIRLRFDLEPGLPAIQADAAQIQQVVMNLVTNAADAIGDREGVIHLSTTPAELSERELQATFRGESLQPGSYVLLEVSDTGGGMAPEVMDRIFDPFFTTKAKGRGLGLSAMLGILRGHGAGLSITSGVGRGSCFRICFPASQEAAAPAHPVGEGPSTPKLKGRVLLVDDEDLILQTIGAALKALGLEVLTARDGMEALERFRERPRPDLVLMDLTMPRLDGREAFQAMQDLDPSVPVILSSGFTQQDSIRTLSGQAPAAFIQKPYQIKVLRQLLQRVLGS